jgi:hypothetical protein
MLESFYCSMNLRFCITALGGSYMPNYITRYKL